MMIKLPLSFCSPLLTELLLRRGHHEVEYPASCICRTWLSVGAAPDELPPELFRPACERLHYFSECQEANDSAKIDHFPHEQRYAPHTKATFKQRYFFDTSYYKPGGPVFLYLSGETSGESRFSNLETGSAWPIYIEYCEL